MSTCRTHAQLEALTSRLLLTREEVEVTLPGDREVHHGHLVDVEVSGFVLALSTGGRRVLRATWGGSATRDLPAWLHGEAA